MREYAFEAALCARLERGDRVVARQVGGGVARPGGRVLDVVLVEPGPEFDRRAAITDDAIPAAAVEGPVGPGRWRRPTRTVEGSRERARAVAERAVEAGYFERAYRDGRPHVRAVARYPDRWFRSITAVENKPDLSRPGALERQLRTDVSLAVADRVVLATASHVTAAHRNRVPDEVGIWRVRPETLAADGDPTPAVSGGGGPLPGVEVLREPTPLPVTERGVEPLEWRPEAVDVAVVDPGAKARARRRIAERAYGTGWRPAAEEFPACARAAGGAGRPGDGGARGDGSRPDDPADSGDPDPPAGAVEGVVYCDWKGRIVDPGSECGPDCPGHDPADPPAADPEAARDRTTPWVADPEGLVRRQSGLDRFRE